MKMLKIILRPESTEEVVDALADSGFVALTKIQAFGRGKQKGIDVGPVHYDELPKTLLLLVVNDEDVDRICSIVRERACTGNFGDGKIFATGVESVMTVRTGALGL